MLVTRVAAELAPALLRALPEGDYDAGGRLFWLGPAEVPIVGQGTIAVVIGRDRGPARSRARRSARRGASATRSTRSTTSASPGSTACSRRRRASARREVVIAVAGMEGALPSVVGGLVDRPVIAVPTSVGYGASFGGVAALLGDADELRVERHRREHRQRVRGGLRRDPREPALRQGLRLHLDLFSGIAGNMFLGALLDAGLSRRALAADLAGLRLPHTLRVRRVRRGALAALYLSVAVPAGPRPAKRPPAKGAARRRAPAAGDEHGSDHHGHGYSPAHGQARAPGHGRHYDEIRRLLDRARLTPPVRDRAQAIFAALARAEARVHGIPVERVHFHEVGAVDAIVDVTGAAIAVERLGVRSVTASPVALGHGSVASDHGRLPLPAPATLELLRGVPTLPAGVAWETVTPTGAAILRTLAEGFGPLPAMTVERIGHGAGDDRPGPMPNVLRAILGSETEVRHERVTVLECNLDDAVPEHFDHWMQRLLAAGALDVSLQHVQTKKNRPGFLVRVLCRPSERGALAELLLEETTTLGVRAVDVDRLALPRESRRIETPFGRISVKIARRPGGQLDLSAEVDECQRAAVRTGTPLREVVRVVEETARARWAKGRGPRPR